MASGNFSSSSVNGLSLYVEWVSVPNTNTNTSQVTATLYVKSYSLRATVLADSYLIVNGSKVGWSVSSLNIGSTSQLKATQVATHTTTVSHDNDGKKSITIKANFEFNGTYGGTYVSDLTASKTVDLDTIPRSSAMSIPTSVNTGSNLTVSITPSSSSFRHKVEFYIDGAQKHISGYIAAGTKSYTYGIPHSWLPKTTSTTMTVYLSTYTASSSDPIARISKTITVNVPANIVPTVTLEKSILNGLNGEYVQGKSSVKLTAKGTPGDGSTVVSYIFKGANIDGTASSYTGTSNTKTSSVILSSGEVKYQVAAKDARGRISDYKSVSINVYTYLAPQVTSISAQRCLKDGTLDKNGTYAKVTVKASYTSINGANTRIVTLYNSGDNYTTGTVALSASNTADTYTGVYGGSFDASSSYTIKALITDAYHNASADIYKDTVVKTAERTLNFAKYGNGICVGGLSSVVSKTAAGKFECNWDAYFNGNLNASSVQSAQTYKLTYNASPNMYITSDGTFARSTSSSQRYKKKIENVSDSSLDPYRILDIPVRQYKYNSDNIPTNMNADDIYIGLIAEEVEQAYPAAAEYNEDGQVEMWNIKVIVPAMLKIIQDQQKEIQDLKEQIKTIH